MFKSYFFDYDTEKEVPKQNQLYVLTNDKHIYVTNPFVDGFVFDINCDLLAMLPNDKIIKVDPQSITKSWCIVYETKQGFLNDYYDKNFDPEEIRFNDPRFRKVNDSFMNHVDGMLMHPEDKNKYKHFDYIRFNYDDCK